MALIVVILAAILLGFTWALAWSMIMAFPVKWLWNYAAVDMFNFHSIDFWHAFALLLLCGMLLKSSSSSSTKSSS